jgi:hypothetical protein
MAGLWLLLALLAFWFDDALTARWLAHLNEHGHAHLHAHGHPFVDARCFFGIPNTWDTVSNAVFLLPGLLGFVALRRLPPLAPALRAGLGVFFAGLLLTAVGSSVYHWAPTGAALALDRAGMAVAFAGLLTVATADRLSPAGAVWMLRASLPLALLAAALPALNGNVLPWFVVQGGGVLWVLVLALARPAGSLGVRLGAVVAWYALAKVLEGADAAVFAATGEWVSGHTLKHLAAAGAAWPVVAAVLRARLPASNVRDTKTHDGRLTTAA